MTSVYCHLVRLTYRYWREFSMTLFFGPEEPFDYISTTAPTSPPPHD